MKRRYLLVTLVALLALLLAFPQIGAGARPDNAPGVPPEDSPGNKDVYAAVPNLSFPLIATDIIQMFYLQTWVDSDGDGVVDGNEWVLTLDPEGNPIPIEVTEVINVKYTGTYPGNDGEEHCVYTLDEFGDAVDINEDGIIDDLDLTCEPMLGWLQDMAPWYDQPVTTTNTDPNLIWNAAYVDAANSWQADWEYRTAGEIYVDFIDWGNPLENINPIVGQRFPVEVALYELLDTTMTAYNMACLEYPGTKVELFGTSDLDGNSFTYESYFATVLTNRFIAEVWNPDGSITKIQIAPGIGPSGKMNFASAGGGWTPTMPGWHRIWLHLNDPLISLSGAIVNNDEHYIMTSGSMAQTLNRNKLELTGIIGDSTYIDVYVERPSGKKSR